MKALEFFILSGLAGLLLWGIRNFFRRGVDSQGKRIVAVVLLLTLTGLYILEYSPAPHRAKAMEPIYGGIISPLPVTTSDVLWYQTTSSVLTNGVTFFFNYRMTCKNNSVINDTWTATININGNGGQGVGKNFPCDGWLNYASFEINNGNVATGSVYEQILILSTMPPNGGQFASVGLQNAQQILYPACGVNANSFFIYAWPGCGINNPTSGAGLNQSLAIGNPAAGANFQQALNALIRHRIINIRYTLTTSAAAGNRFACVNFLTGGVAGTIVGSSCSPYAQQPSQTVTYNFAAGVGWATNCSFLGGTQTALLCADMTIPMATFWETTAGFESFAIDSAVLSGSGVSGIQAADQISSISIRETIWQELD